MNIINKKAKLIYITILIFFCQGTGYAQKEMTKEEILDYWGKHELDKPNDSIILVRFNDELNKKVENIIDSLNKEKIDSIIIYSIRYSGFYSMNSENVCVSKLYNPTDVYIFWKHYNQVYIKEIINGCDSITKKTNSTNIFDYYVVNQNIINKDIVMPNMYKCVLKEDSTIVFSLGSGNSESEILEDKITDISELDLQNYSICYKIGDIFKQKRFTENDIANEKSLFYEHNKNLKTYKWFKLIRNFIKDRYKSK